MSDLKISLLDAKLPVWSRADQSSLDVEAHFSHIAGWIPFTAIDQSGEEHAQEVWDRVNSGEFGPIGDFPEPTPEPLAVIIPAVTLWERMTEAEADQVAAVMETQPFRTRKIFETAATFRSDHELWPLLEQIANQLFGKDRAVELLAS